MNVTPTNSTLNEQDIFYMCLTKPSILFFMMLNFSVGLPLNIYIIIQLIRAGGLDGAIIFKLNQTVSEILFALQTPLFILCQVNRRDLCFEKPAIFVTSICMTTRFFFQCCVGSERYLAVVHPVLFLKLNSIKHRLTCSSLIWVSSAIAAIVTVCELSDLLFSVAGILNVVILIAHLVFCFSILRILRKPGPGERGRKDGGSNIKKKAFELISLNLFAFLIQALPPSVTLGVKNMLSFNTFSSVYFITIYIYIVAGILQPVLILHGMGQLSFIKCV